MKRKLAWVFLTLFIGTYCHAGWFTDLDAAMIKAKADDRMILLDFTGSDWCGWCMKLTSEVYSQPDFLAYADANLVLVEVDFPQAHSLSAAQMEANAKLKQKYQINGYPTTIILDSDGKELGKKVGYVPGGPKAFIEMIEKFPGARHPRLAPVPPIKYGDLTLKAVSGSKDRRMALVNNETLMVGDTAKIKVHDTKVEVTCKEIREDAVVLLVDGKTKELKLAHGAN